jgi:hypothetical protein
MTLVATGIGVLLVVPKLRPHPTHPYGEPLAVLASGFASVGAGLLAPFHKKMIGALSGLVLMFAFIGFIIWTMQPTSGPRRLPRGFKFTSLKQASVPPRQTQ